MNKQSIIVVTLIIVMMLLPVGMALADTTAPQPAYQATATPVRTWYAKQYANSTISKPMNATGSGSGPTIELPDFDNGNPLVAWLLYNERAGGGTTASSCRMFSLRQPTYELSSVSPDGIARRYTHVANYAYATPLRAWIESTYPAWAGTFTNSGYINNPNYWGGYTEKWSTGIGSIAYNCTGYMIGIYEQTQPTARPPRSVRRRWEPIELSTSCPRWEQ